MLEIEKYYQQLNLSKSLMRPSLFPPHYHSVQQQSLYGGFKSHPSFNQQPLLPSLTTSFVTTPTSSSFLSSATLKNQHIASYLYNNPSNLNGPFNSHPPHNTHFNKTTSLNSNPLFNSFFSSPPHLPSKELSFDSQTFHPKQYMYNDNPPPSSLPHPLNHHDHTRLNSVRPDQARLPVSPYKSPFEKPSTDAKHFNQKKWLEGLKAMFPNVNISFGPSPPFVKPQDDTSREQAGRGDLLAGRHNDVFNHQHFKFAPFEPSNKNFPVKSSFFSFLHVISAIVPLIFVML